MDGLRGGGTGGSEEGRGVGGLFGRRKGRVGGVGRPA